jgi:hypothetical protein
MTEFSQDKFRIGTDASPEDVKLLGDLVLLEEIHEEPSGLVLDASMQLTRDKRWIKRRESGNRRGRVLKVGPGDAVMVWICRECRQESRALIHRLSIHTRSADGWSGIYNTPECRCGAIKGPDGYEIERAPMNTTPGDIVVFRGVPNNEVRLKGKDYVVVHEEQHILAIEEAVRV